MKLLTKTSLNFLTISLFIFLIGTITFYYLLRQQVDQNINLELEKRKVSIISKLQSVHSSSQIPPTQDEKIIINPIQNKETPKVSYSDTIIFNQEMNKYIAYRQMDFVTTVNNQDFVVTIYKSLSETDNLIVRILILLTGMVVVFITTLLILNRHTSQKAWKVFYDTIHKINTYNINSHGQFQFNESDIKEFNDLNRVLEEMTERINKNYISLKEYTENAAHELQTPLAIINSKMELLLQSDNLDEKQVKTVAEAFEAASKLARINKTLLLLAKIENRQFPEIKEVIPLDIIKIQLELLEDLISAKQITVKQLPKESYRVEMNPYLAETLLSNLLKNAIRHNVQGGNIEFMAGENFIQISNSGAEEAMDEKKLFQRFHKSEKVTESLGLGLAIVQKICEASGFQVSYKFEEGKHHFRVEFG